MPIPRANFADFGLLSWTQRIKLKLINPLLGNNCYVGTDQNPIVVNPQISSQPRRFTRRHT